MNELTLPDQFNTSIYFTPEELDALQSSPSRVYTEERLESIQQNFEKIKSLAKGLWQNAEGEEDPFNLSVEGFKWALSNIWSRTVPVRFPDQEHVVAALVPLVDMFNMADPSAPDQIKVGYDQNGIYYTATIDIPESTEIFARYGTLSNSQLLLDYGFALEKNRDDFMSLVMPLLESDSDELKQRKVDLIAAIGTANMIRISRAHMPNDVIRIGRIIVATNEELDNVNLDSFGEKPVNSRNEQACMEFLIRGLSNALKSYGTTIEEDTKLLQTTKNHKLRSAIILRKGEKLILRDVIQRIAKRYQKATGESNTVNNSQETILQ
eukprot:TRINITY_DN5081_c0_g2_i1.p1 TRINITY_DN5081_c0_g2~~TRINITY_DN5081_c0_g2_i1.p1  ORF type:complete len:323 (-),score=73.49 TRINITY_DN5081_c0_g2_i1:15-983(-)